MEIIVHGPPRVHGLLVEKPDLGNNYLLEPEERPHCTDPHLEVL